MLGFSQIQNVFPSRLRSPYDRKLQQDIDAYPKVYPPKTDNALKHFHQSVCDASVSTYQKLSLFYYVLLDFDLVNEPPYASQEFMAASGIPLNYQLFMQGLWYMDRLEFARAVEYLSHPSLDPDFSDDIIIALVEHAPAHDCSLPLAYFTSVRPVLKTSRAAEMIFDAMTKTNMTEALLYSRTFPEYAREQLFKRLIASVLNESQGGETASQASELVCLPLNATEDGWFEEYLSSGDGRALPRAKDLLLGRRIACDKFGELAKYKANNQWAGVLEGIKKGINGLSN